MSCLSVPVAEDGQPEHGRGSYVYGYGFDELVASMPSMAGKTIAVTGSTSGTGYVLAREAANKGARVLPLNRPSPRADAAARGEARACQNRKKQIRHKLHILGGREVAQPTVFKGIPMVEATNARIILKLVIVFVKHLKCSWANSKQLHCLVGRAQSRKCHCWLHKRLLQHLLARHGRTNC